MPLAIAALRHDRRLAQDLVVKAITESDNPASEQLWSQLGNPADAARQVENFTDFGHFPWVHPGLLGDRALHTVRASGGSGIAVDETEILDAVRLLGQDGLMIEPSGAVTVAAVRRGVREGSIDPGESVVCVLTGSGFKDFDRILDLVEIPSQVIAGYEAMVAEAERIGFVTQVVSPDRLDAAVAEMAAVLASKPPGVMRMGRDSFYAVLDSAATEALPYLHAMLTVTSQTAEAAEGIAAFIEKRPPAWQVSTETDPN